MTEIEILQQIASTIQNIYTVSVISMSMILFAIGLYATDRIRKLKESRLNK